MGATSALFQSILCVVTWAETASQVQTQPSRLSAEEGKCDLLPGDTDQKGTWRSN